MTTQTQPALKPPQPGFPVAVAHAHPIELLRFNTCGSVDEGKSKLIGRLAGFVQS